MIDWDHHTWREHFFQMRDQVKPIVDAAMARYEAVVEWNNRGECFQPRIHELQNKLWEADQRLNDACRRAKEGR